MRRILNLFLICLFTAAGSAAERLCAIKAGNLIDPENGSIKTNQIILIENGLIKEIGDALPISDSTQVIDLSDQFVLPGLVDAHDHLALTYKQEPESNNYYLTTVMDGTPLRAIQAFSNGFQKMASGFTIVRDLGNAGNYADTALRIAIEQGWVPGPTLVNSGIIIGGMGGQVFAGTTPNR